ncbi:MAG: histidine phosphatase family protein [Clostridia bacterium]|nr:histidine phosphatase family protein [Clostridia bacterium]
MKLYMIRHGESLANREVRFSLPSTPLTERGIADAESAGRLLRGKTFDRVLVSPYLRARQTCQHALPEAEAEVVELLHEFDCGRLEGNTYADMLAEHKELAELLKVDNFRTFGGEDYADVRQRVREFMDYAVGLNADRIAAFTHAGFIATFFDEILQRPGKIGRNISCSNGSINIFSYQNGQWRVSALNITEQF